MKKMTPRIGQGPKDILFPPKTIGIWRLVLALSALPFGLYAQLGVNFDIVHLSCSNIPTGRITAMPTGGVPPYRFRWENGDTTASRSRLLSGTYSLTLSDAAANTLIESVTINSPTPVRVTFDVSGNCTLPVTITATASGGEGPYRYLWETGQIGATQVFPTSGKYCVTVIDNKLCGRYECLQVSVAPLFASLSTRAVTCPGSNDGALNLSVSGGTPPLSYLWSNGATSQHLSNVPGGDYSVTVTDAIGCSLIRTATVAAPAPLVVNLTATGPSCAGETNGSIQINNISGGTPPYRVQWHTGQNTMTISGLAEMTYILTITDAFNCRIIREVNLLARSQLQTTATVRDETCPGQNNGSVALSMQTGVAPFTVAWSDGGTGANRTGMAPGAYSASITDAVGCQRVIGAVIRPAAPYTLTVAKTDLTSCSVNNGSAEAIISGGAGPFTFSWSNGQTGARVVNLAPGTYTVTVRDVNGCAQTASTIVLAPPPISAQVTATAQVCQGAANGSASTTVAGGTAPFSFVWNNGGSSQALQNLSSGIYRVTVTDGRNCTATAQATIAQAPRPEVDVIAPAIVCNGLDTAGARTLVSGGTAPFTYFWNTGGSGPNLLNLPSGTYRVTVSDRFGCTATDSARILVVPAIQLTASVTPVLCSGENNGQINVLSQGGLPPLSFVWSNGATGASIGNLRAGSYSATATDAAGCRANISALVTQPDSLSLVLTTVNIQCGIPATGEASVRVQGGTPPYNYLWNTGASRDTITGLDPGSYTVVVTDARGCEKAVSGAVLNVTAPLCSIAITRPVSSPTASDGEAVVTVNGGRAPYTFRWSNGQAGDTVRNLPAGDYSVTVTDANGCTGICSVSAAPETALIGGYVWFDINQNGLQDAGEREVPGIKVLLMEITSTPPPFMDTVLTDVYGRYRFVVKPGSYKVTFVLPDSFQFSVPNATLDRSIDSDADRILGTTQTITVAAGEVSLFWDAGLINNTKFFPAIECECLNNATNPVNGQFRELVQLQGLSGDNWRIIRQSGMFLRTSPAPPAAPIPVAVGTVMPEVTTGVYVFEFRHVDNLGYFIEVSNGMDTLSLENRCAYPFITDNIPDTFCFNDQVLPLNLPVTLSGRITYTINGVNATAINPRALGAGLFQLVARFVPDNPLECQATRTIPFRVITESCQVKIGDRVWNDKNKNGVQDNNEEGIGGVKVILSRVGTQITHVDSVLTDSVGMYMFLTDPGNYKLTFVPPIPGFRAPMPDQGGNDTKDSDIDTLNFMTPVYTVALHNNNFTVDAGFIIPCVNVTDAGEIGISQSICFGAPTPPIVNLREASGGYGKLEYLWMYSTRSAEFDVLHFVPVPNSNTPSIQPGLLTETTFFVRCVRRAACMDYLEPAPVRIFVKPKISATLTVRDTYCLDAPIHVKAEVAGEGAQVRWELSAREPGTFVEPNIAFGTVATFVPKASGVVYVRTTITQDGCSEIFTDSFRIVNIPGYCASAGIVLNALVDQQNRINLRWRIPDDTPYRQFQVEHAPDGEQWKPVGEVSKIMTMFEGLRYYEFIDAQGKNGRNFYRIAVQDEFGVRRLSNVVSVALQPEAPTAVYAFPNPVNALLYLDILRNLPVNEQVHFDLMSTTGRLIRSWAIPGQQVQERVDFSDLPVGVYLIRVRAGSATPPQVLKILKQ